MDSMTQRQISMEPWSHTPAYKQAHSISATDYSVRNKLFMTMQTALCYSWFPVRLFTYEYDFFSLKNGKEEMYTYIKYTRI